MLSVETKEYVYNWNKKVSLIEGDNLEDVFDKFGSLYKIFGRLNFDMTNELINQGRLAKKNGDQKSATINTIQFLTADEIIKGFKNSNNEFDIEALIKVLPHFSIKFTADGLTAEPAVDQQLLVDLQSANNDTKALAILQVIYFVRCNFEHSRKNFHEYQRLLVEPLNNLLSTINSLLLVELAK